MAIVTFQTNRYASCLIFISRPSTVTFALNFPEIREIVVCRSPSTYGNSANNRPTP
jgi:hypothetical protein